jgi:molybdopterin-guanine dinucleotide biosynthesis protein A
MPMIQPAAIWWLFGARRLGTSIVLPRIGDRVEPLLALYEPSALGLLEEAAATGQLALHRLASRSSVRCVEPPASLRESWFNANTPADLQSLEAS